MTEIEFY